MLDEGDFIAQATRAGFDGKMAQFMYDSLAQVDHEHKQFVVQRILQRFSRTLLDDDFIEEDEEEETEEA